MRVDACGIDIGKNHTAICGMDCTDLAPGKWPRLTAVSLVDAKHRAASDCCDVLDRLLTLSADFDFLRGASSVYVEQQFPGNPQAKQVAQGIRTNLRTLRLAAGGEPDVHTVSANSKYVVATVIAPGTLDDELRKTDLTGAKGKKGRKRLGQNDVHTVLTETQQGGAIEMIASVCRELDQVHDITDAALIALSGELLKAPRKRTARGTPYGSGQRPVPRPRASRTRAEPPARPRKRC